MNALIAPATESPIAGRKLRVVLAGAGKRGQYLARGFQSSPSWDLQAICDVKIQRARQVAAYSGGMPAFPSLDETLDRIGPDAVAVATPVETRRGLVMSALRAGLHVLVEEPMTVRLSDGLDMVYEAASQGVVLMVDHARCYSPAAVAVQRFIKSGLLGDVLFIDSLSTTPLRKKRQVTDAVWALAAPELAVLDFILPGRLAVTEVSARAGDFSGTGQRAVLHLDLKFSSNATAHVQVSCADAAPGRRMVIGGSSRTLVWDGVDVGREPAQSAREFSRRIRAGGDTKTEPSGLVILSVLEAGRRSFGAETLATGQGALP